MSKGRVAYKNAHYHLTVDSGDEHGPTLQVWDDTLPKDDFTSPAVEVDSISGVRIWRSEACERNPQLGEVVLAIRAHFTSFKAKKGCWPWLLVQDVCDVARCLGLYGVDLEAVVSRLLQTE